MSSGGGSLQQSLQQLTDAQLAISEFGFIETCDAFHEVITTTKEEIDILIRARNEELKELERQVENAETKAQVLEDEINSTIESSRLYEEESSKQEELYAFEEQQLQILQAENLELERELATLNQYVERETGPTMDQLRIAIYRKMGIASAAKNQREEKVVISSDNDIRTVSLQNNTKSKTADYIWDFISK